jgi:predicted Holliday junction resolvase-like endonuclease
MAIENLFSGFGGSPLSLTEQQKQNIYSTAGYTPGGQLTKKSTKALQKSVKKGTLGVSGQFTDILASAFPTTAFQGAPAKLGKQFARAGYAQFNDQFIKPLTAEAIRQAGTSGYSIEDTKKAIANKFAAGQVSEEARRFMMPTYKTDPKTGRFMEAASSAISIGKGEDGGTASTTSSPISQFQNFLEGLNPDQLPGYTPGEIDYATQIDPYKIQAKSAKQIAKIGQGTALYGLIPAGIL